MNDRNNLSSLQGGIYVPIEEIMPDPNQPRTYFDPLYIKALAESMKAGAQYEAVQVEELVEGEKDPRYPNAKYILVGGENRWRAANLGQITHLRIDLAEKSDNPMDRHLKALGLNGVRQPLNRMDTARAFRAQLDRKDVQMTMDRLARITGKSTITISNYLSLLRLPREMQVLLDPPTPPEKRIQMVVAMKIATRVRPEKMLQTFREIQKLPTKSEREHAANSLVNESRKGRRRKPSDEAEVVRVFVARTAARVNRFRRVDMEAVAASIKRGKGFNSNEFLKKVDDCIQGLQDLRGLIAGEEK